METVFSQVFAVQWLLPHCSPSPSTDDTRALQNPLLTWKPLIKSQSSQDSWLYHTLPQSFLKVLISEPWHIPYSHPGVEHPIALKSYKPKCGWVNFWATDILLLHADHDLHESNNKATFYNSPYLTHGRNTPATKIFVTCLFGLGSNDNKYLVDF